MYWQLAKGKKPTVPDNPLPHPAFLSATGCACRMLNGNLPSFSRWLKNHFKKNVWYRERKEVQMFQDSKGQHFAVFEESLTQPSFNGSCFIQTFLGSLPVSPLQ